VYIIYLKNYKENAKERNKKNVGGSGGQLKKYSRLNLNIINLLLLRFSRAFSFHFHSLSPPPNN